MTVPSAIKCEDMYRPVPFGSGARNRAPQHGIRRHKVPSTERAWLYTLVWEHGNGMDTTAGTPARLDLSGPDDTRRLSRTRLVPARCRPGECHANFVHACSE